MAITPPCKGCGQRTGRCHIDCTAYQEYARQNECLRKKRLQALQAVTARRESSRVVYRLWLAKQKRH